jgi:hypothetical protein
MRRRSVLALIFFVLVGLVFGMISLARADCPDMVICQIPGGFGSSSNIDVGSFSTPTCYKFWAGCKPWHCKGNTTNQDYWDQECRRRFVKECTKENHCFAYFRLP